MQKEITIHRVVFDVIRETALSDGGTLMQISRPELGRIARATRYSNGYVCLHG